IALGTSCPDHFLRTKIRPLFLGAPAVTGYSQGLESPDAPQGAGSAVRQEGERRPADAVSDPLEGTRQRLTDLHAAYRQEYADYYQRNAVADSPPMRGADPAIFLLPGVGMFSFGATA